MLITFFVLQVVVVGLQALREKDRTQEAVFKLCKTACHDIRSELDEEKPVIGIDTEGTVELVQISTKKRTYIFDNFNSQLLRKSPDLRALLADPDISKLFHACSNDVTKLRNQYAVELGGPVLDTTVIATKIIKGSGVVTITSDTPIALDFNTICHGLGVPGNHLKSEMDRAWWRTGRYNDGYWRKNRFSEFDLSYAALDVFFLVSDVLPRLRDLEDRYCPRK